MHIGTTWVYQVSDSNAFTKINTMREVRMRIIKDTIQSDKTLAYIVKQENGTEEANYFLWYVKGSIFYESFRNSPVEHIKYKSPLNLNDSWLQRDSVGDLYTVVKSWVNYTILGMKSQAYEIVSGDPIVKNGVRTGYFSSSIYAPYIGLTEFTEIQNFYGYSRSTWRLTAYYTN